MNRSISVDVTRRDAPIWTHASWPASKSRQTEEREIRSASAASTMVRSRLVVVALASGEFWPVVAALGGCVGHTITSCVVVFHHCNSPW
jgi:hypothetical protein